MVLAFAVIALAGGAGWMAGSSGRALVEQERAREEMRAEFADARASILAGQVAVFENSPGNAVQDFQNARDRIGQIQTQLREIGQPEQAGRLNITLSQLSDAQHFAAAFDDKAHGAAEDALKTLVAAGQ
jgi:hypothetical protein